MPRFGKYDELISEAQNVALTPENIISLCGTISNLDGEYRDHIYLIILEYYIRENNKQNISNDKLSTFLKNVDK